MPTFSHGKSMRILIDKYDASYWLKQAQFSHPVDVAETSSFGTSAKSFVVGLSNFQMGFGGMYEDTPTTGFDAVMQPLVGAESLYNFAICPRGTGIGKTCYATQGSIVSYDISGSISDMASANVNVQGSGLVTSGKSQASASTVIPFPASGAYPRMSALANVDAGSGTYTGANDKGGQVFLFVTDSQATLNTITVRLMSSADGATAWNTHATFSALAAGVEQSLYAAIAPSTGNPILRYTRLEVDFNTGDPTGTIGLTAIFARTIN